ncbi:putative transposase [Wolbachia endosymbiont of Trichogramma pretiosum]|nr:putative transposase [Wolbachia endosymbiont of Trichogramma pretiosum]
MSIIGCILITEIDLIPVSIAIPMQTFFDSIHIAYQKKNIDNIKIDSDVGFDFFDSSVRSSLNCYK